MWAYPNLIPLPPDAIHQIWVALKPFEFDRAFAGFPRREIRHKRVKAKVLESIKIFVQGAGYRSHAILEERL
jgi:hypothetical protein